MWCKLFNVDSYFNGKPQGKLHLIQNYLNYLNQFWLKFSFRRAFVMIRAKAGISNTLLFWKCDNKLHSICSNIPWHCTIETKLMSIRLKCSISIFIVSVMNCINAMPIYVYASVWMRESVVNVSAVDKLDVQVIFLIDHTTIFHMIRWYALR